MGDARARLRGAELQSVACAVLREAGRCSGGGGGGGGEAVGAWRRAEEEAERWAWALPCVGALQTFTLCHVAACSLVVLLLLPLCAVAEQPTAASTRQARQRVETLLYTWLFVSLISQACVGVAAARDLPLPHLLPRPPSLLASGGCRAHRVPRQRLPFARSHTHALTHAPWCPCARLTTQTIARRSSPATRRTRGRAPRRRLRPSMRPPTA